MSKKKPVPKPTLKATTPRERRVDFLFSIDRRELINHAMKSAERAFYLLGTLSESSYANPVTHEVGSSAYKMLASVFGDQISLQRITEALCDMPPGNPEAKPLPTPSRQTNDNSTNQD